MSPQRLDPVSDAVQVRRATAELLESLTTLTAAQAAAPSRLPGWSRGHLLTHLARNADAMVNLLTWARTGVETPMYGPGDARERDIEAGSGRPPADLLADLRGSAARLDEAVAAMPARAWQAQIPWRGGVTVPAAVAPFRRLGELYLHGVDLGLGRRCEDLPGDYALREADRVLTGLAGRADAAPARVRDDGSGQEWRTGTGEPGVLVEGPTTALVGWVTGRSDGSALRVTPSLPLPVLPPLG